MVVARTKAKGTKTSAGVVAAALNGGPADEEEAPAPRKKGAKGSGVQRDVDGLDIPEARRKNVARWQDNIRADKKYYEDVWKRMRRSMEYARLGADKEWVKADKYTVPLINRFITQAVSSLYAKNPKAVAKRKKKMLYTLWDGTLETAKAAYTLAQQGDQNSQAILQEIEQGKTYDQMIDRLGKTLEILYEHFTGADYPDFKKQMKALVRRTKTVGVGYLELDFHRAMEADPDITQRIGDMTAKLERIKSLQADLKDKIIDKSDAEADELASAIKTLEEEKMQIVSEGLMFSFPRATDIIPHKACRQLSGFIGCEYITREFRMDTEEIQETWKIDVRDNYKVYVDATGGDAAGNSKEGDRDTHDSSEPGGMKGGNKEAKGKACVWRVYNKKTREVFVLVEGYPDYVQAPAPPELKVSGFWTVFPLIFNEVEDELEVFPMSDADYLRHPQREFNNAREGMREHRRANRPKYFVKKGALEEKEKKDIETAPAHAVIELKGIEANLTIEQLIQPYKGVAIDPNLYETSSIVKDILYGVGAQEADMGQTGDATATESSIAAQSHASTLASNVDDLDEFLSEIARASSQALLQQMDGQTVKEIVGPGAIWPQLDNETISKGLYLEIKAGSAGRPNQAMELANLERGMNFLIQLGGINPTVLGRKYCDLLNFDEEELIVEGLPSITAMNAMAAAQAQVQAKGMAGAPPAGPPGSMPNQQGPQGAANMAKPPGTTPQGQPAYPASVKHYNSQGAPMQ